jgi:hypothetical protein
MSFPTELNYGSNKPMSAAGKPMIARFRSDNTEYNNGDVIRIEIPTGRAGQHLFPKSSFIEGQVKVNVSSGATNLANEGVYIDQSVFALFNRIRVIHGSTTIEDFLYCNKVWTSILDLQYSESERRALSITHLVAGDGATNTVPAYNAGLCGFKLGNASATASTAVTTANVDFCFPLPSAVLGTLSQKALPLGQCGAGSIYLELTLESPNVAFMLEDISGTASIATINSYTVSQIYYNGKITNLPADVDQALLQSTGGIINLPAVSYKAEYKTIANGTTTFTDKFSFQFSSLKCFCFFIQAQTVAMGVANKRSVSSRPKAYIQDYFLSINGEAFPSQTIQTPSRMYAELLRAYDALTDTSAGGIINYNNYAINNVINGSGVFSSTAKNGYGSYSTTLPERFLAGIDLDRFNHQSSTLMSGTSSIGQLVSLILNFDPAFGVNANTSLYAFCMYDVMYNVENGQITMRI